MSERITRFIDEKINSFEEIKVVPQFKKNSILIPLNFINNYAEEDGLSLGAPVDEGWYATVTYSEMRGALVEDTLAAIQRSRNLKLPKVWINDYFQYRTVDDWQEGLNKSWIKELDDPTDINNLYHWPQEWQEKYKEFFSNLHNKIVEQGKLVIEFKGSKLYTHNDEYFALFKGWHHDAIVPATYADEFMSIEDAGSALNNAITLYNDITNARTQLAETIKTNIQLIKKWAYDE